MSCSAHVDYEPLLIGFQNEPGEGEEHPTHELLQAASWVQNMDVYCHATARLTGLRPHIKLHSLPFLEGHPLPVRISLHISLVNKNVRTTKLGSNEPKTFAFSELDHNSAAGA
eukprot:TRINITY_DN68632_c0_g1_i1.p1 TRINITY_DN68632_c0_g1~~TRINITY_DN68632_c0_g1_i1.p1  ORF type:complete len:120 (-),score=10.78 TRINITY_DN68632_c0_g1_i1:59-397(-)